MLMLTDWCRFLISNLSKIRLRWCSRVVILSQTCSDDNCRQHRLPFLNALDALLRNCHPLDSPFLPTLLAKTILPSIAAVLSTTPGNVPCSTELSSGRNNKGKKRSRNYEGDEIFNVSREVACATDGEGKVLLASIDGKQFHCED
jgi:hypothetical protein